VQETLLRAVERPPADTSRPWRPWLVRVATNLARDQLRRRRRRGYDGPWLPEPVETAALVDPSYEPPSTEGRYELLESISYAFLVALEALTPSQRAILVLCDVLDYDAAEAAQALDMKPGAVRTALHRARRRMAAYDAKRVPLTRSLARETRELLQRFVLGIASGDVAGMEALLTEDVVALNDAGGAFSAARVPVLGPAKVARFHRRIAGRPPTAAEIREMNGLPALWVEVTPDPERPHLASRFVMLVVPDGAGRLRGVHMVLAPAKLARIRPITSLEPDASQASG
jgi:RNA polymerase sigma-70 factor (ECF subfamily)